MNNSMPTMNIGGEDETSLPTIENSPLGEENSLPGEISNEVDLKPKLEDPNKNNSDKEISVPVTGNKAIEVVATQKGFYNQRRVEEGTTFKMKCFEDLGTWVKCTDSAIEKKRVEFFKNKKKAKK